jgi:hypothetical protein
MKDEMREVTEEFCLEMIFRCVLGVEQQQVNASIVSVKFVIGARRLGSQLSKN